jgi:hypothetical protein
MAFRESNAVALRRWVREIPASISVALIAVTVTAAVFSVVSSRASTASLSVGFRFERSSIVLPPAAAASLGGPLSGDEIQTIERIARRELARAYAGTRLSIGDTADAFWHIDVRNTIRGAGRAIPNAGHAVVLGPLGGLAEVNFTVLATSAIRLAPPGASRAAIVEGIGRGVGRAAVHELAHQIVSTAAMDNRTDPDSYEYSSFSRPSQYYGELHWAGAWPILVRKVGK